MRGGPEGNERLTASSGVVLFVLLAAEGVTILSIRPLLSAHVFIGMLLIPPVALKLASTGWRFVRYYRGAPEYTKKGPPLLPLRLLAPVVLLSRFPPCAQSQKIAAPFPSTTIQTSASPTVRRTCERDRGSGAALEIATSVTLPMRAAKSEDRLRS